MKKLQRSKPPSPAPLPWLRCGLAALLAGAVHATSLRVPFVYDDFPTVVENASLHEPTSLLAILLFARFRPLVNVSYALDHAVWGFAPFGFHLTNVLLHAANASLVFLVAWYWEQDGAPEVKPSGTLATVTAVLFCVHPLLTDAVSYVSGRSELLGGLFFLGGLLACRRALRGGGPRWWLGTVLLLVLGLACKEIVAVLPLVALAYAWLRLHRADSEARRSSLLALAPLLLLVGVGAAFRVAFYLLREAAFAPRGLWQNWLLQQEVLWRYLALVFVPLGQSLVHPFQEVTHLFDPLALLAAAGWVAVGVLAVAVRKAAPAVSFGLAWFFLLLLPSSSLIPLAEPMSEHRAYLASVGLFLAVGDGCRRALDRWKTSTRRAAVVALGTLGAAFAGLTLARNQVWSDPRRLWSEAAERAPRVWAAQYGLGEAHRLAGDCDQAVAPYRRATELVPQEPRAHINLGICLATRGEVTLAYRSLTQALALRPNEAPIYANLATLALMRGNPHTARAYLQRASELEPMNPLRRERLAAVKDGTDAAPWPPRDL